MTAGPDRQHILLANQHQVVAGMLESLRPHWRNDRALPQRIDRLIRSDRRFGSRDRRLYRELLYAAVRVLPWIEQRSMDEALGIVAHLAAELPATSAFRARYANPSLLAELDPEELLPQWLRDECPAAFEPTQRDVLLQRAPLWIRLHTGDPESIRQELQVLHADLQPSGVLPQAWRVTGEVDLTRTASHEAGEFEVQDLGSQLILASVDPAPGERWLDACAGAGGKSLQLAGLLGAGGRVEVHDPRPAALQELARRVSRAGFRQITTVAVPVGEFDGVLVDAPCSGSGTWRRSPHLKWVTTPADVARAAGLQLRLLHQFSRHVRPGGRLIYATCSLCKSENEAVVQRFLDEAKAFAIEPPAQSFGFTAGKFGLPILPAGHNTDGFFVASLRRSAS